MKTSVIAGAALCALASTYVFATPIDVDTLAKNGCRSEIQRYDARIAELEKLIADTEASNQKTMTEFVYPKVAETVRYFETALPQAESLLSAELSRTAAEYNQLSQALSQNSKYSATVKETAAWELARTYDDLMKNLIARDFKPMGKAWANGNWITFGEEIEGWGVYFSPTSVTTAGTIKYMAMFSNEKLVGKDHLRFLTVRLEFRYDPATKTMIGLPASLKPGDIDAMLLDGIKSKGDRQTGLFFMSSPHIAAAKKQIDDYRNWYTYKACKELLK